MPSLRARIVNTAVKVLLRRRSWGDERKLARRARLLFGVPSPVHWLWSTGLRITKVNERGVKGEWVAGIDATDEVVLYFHGGGFVSCSPATHRPITSGLVRRAGVRIFCVDYRLAPEHPFPAALEDTFAAYRWLLAQGIPAKSIGLAGDSAGGGLVLSTLLKIRDEGLALPAFGICFSPWTDLTGESLTVTNMDGQCAMFRKQNIADFAAIYLGKASARNPYASPLHAELHGLSAMLFQVGSTELLLDDSRVPHEKILASGGQSTLQIYDDLFHCWQMLDGLLPESALALEKAADFIRSHFKSPAE